jgi:hypothetical protein
MPAIASLEAGEDHQVISHNFPRAYHQSKLAASKIRITAILEVQNYN